MSRNKNIALAALLALAGCAAQPGSGGRPATAARVPLVDPDAVLPPQVLLREDTVTALTHNRSQSRLAYVGVWAVDADHCAMMDQTRFEGFAVITPDSLRQPGETCSFEPGAPGEGSVRVEASCKRNRKTSQRPILLEMLNSQSLVLSNDADGPGTKMIRCHLQH
ncbi:hypothetical protein OEG84_00770 [Hoeflea sp. G2-23]|uniref:Lipoprotein n=1 Tax=Hoeflea algicola TaxID=2983763 RepID=A0ABT3Z4P8_9HYPH|nr:hypothetical protein [Hoeflea algicola]MCY0146286.1 hypothetical protein [Hoeflea algicola]